MLSLIHEATVATIQDDLWARQLEIYPRSVRLTPQQVIEWARSDNMRAERRLRAISMALQYPIHVWYYIPGIAINDVPNSVTGCRIGLVGHEHLSNFSDL